MRMTNSILDGLWGHGGLQTASLTSEIEFDISFEIRNSHYPDIHVHVTHAILEASEVIIGPNDLWGHIWPQVWT